MKKIVALLLILVSMMPFAVGCAPKVSNDPDTLEIYVLDVGYGTSWLDSMILEFQNQAWVKEKYPNLNIPSYQKNSEQSFAKDRINVGENNTIDLFFTTDPYDLYSSVYKGQPMLEDLTDLYSKKIPNENLTLTEKMLDSVVYSSQYITDNNEVKFLGVPWASGMDGILYNIDILNSLDKEVPLTTDQFVELCEYIKSLKNNTEAAYKNGYSIISSAHEAGYWRFILPILWAQYEGVEEYENFWQGIYDGSRSKDIFRQNGRKEALKVLESLLSIKNGYFAEESAIHDFKAAQTRFLMGEGVFQVNGDWFDMENSTTKKGLASKGIDYDFGIMKTPIISSIVNKTPSLRLKVETNNSSATQEQLKKLYDAELANIVSAIDNGATSYEGISISDFKAIASARTIVESIGPRHLGIIPTYAKAKDVAKDFLIFMATDTANKIYTENTMGASLPYKYDIKNKAPELYATLSPIHKTRIEIFENETNKVTILPSEMRYPLALYGGLASYTRFGNIEVEFLKANHLSAEQIHQNEINHWTEERWNILKASAGL